MAIATVPAVTDARELALLKAVGLDRAAPEQRELAMNIAQRYELDLLLKHLVLIDGKPYVTRDALLYIAHRSGQFDGIQVTTPEVVGDEWRCTATVWRKDFTHPFVYGGRYPVKGSNVKFAPEMAIKVAESMALRRAFNVAAPVVEERWDVDVPVVPAEPPKSLAEKAAEKRAEIETPAPVEPKMVEAGLTKRQFVDELAVAGIETQWAASVRQIMFGDAELTDAQRRELLTELTKPAPEAASEPLFTEGEWAEAKA